MTAVTWHPVAEVADLAGTDVIGRTVGGRRIAVYRIGERYFATSGVCTHGGAPLPRGAVVAGYIECPLHFGLLEIASGKAAGAPVSVDLPTYPVRVSGSRSEVELDGQAVRSPPRRG